MNTKHDEHYDDIDRVCLILERAASTFPPDSEEATAIADAAFAFTVLRQHQSLAAAWRSLKATSNDEIPQEVLDRMRDVGISTDDLDDVPPKP